MAKRMSETEFRMLLGNGAPLPAKEIVEMLERDGIYIPEVKDRCKCHDYLRFRFERDQAEFKNTSIGEFDKFWKFWDTLALSEETYHELYWISSDWDDELYQVYPLSSEEGRSILADLLGGRMSSKCGNNALDKLEELLK